MPSLNLRLIHVPWKCPSCQTQIRQDAGLPKFGQIYRCPVCRLELTVNAETGRFDVVTMNPRTSTGRERERDF